MIKRHKWGWGITLIDRGTYKVKLLCFRAGANTSMQRHKFRRELWLHLLGKGFLYLGRSKYDMPRHRYQVVSPNTWHKFIAKKRTIIMEVQFGKKCEESDIERA